MRGQLEGRREAAWEPVKESEEASVRQGTAMQSGIMKERSPRPEE